MDEGKRFYRLLSSYLNSEWERIRGVIDDYDGGDPSAATAELDEAMGTPRRPAPPAFPSPQRPIPTQAPSPQHGQAPATTPSAPGPLDQHYAVLGLPAGSDFALIRRAYQKLARRAEASRFESGSEAAQQAAAIRKRVDEAYAALRKALDPSAARFSELELG
jgi:DnaJ-domain-containing protein 1